jgi:hypothetical protein
MLKTDIKKFLIQFVRIALAMSALVTSLIVAGCASDNRSFRRESFKHESVANLDKEIREREAVLVARRKIDSQGRPNSATESRGELCCMSSSGSYSGYSASSDLPSNKGFTFDNTRNSSAEVERDRQQREAEAQARRDAYAREHGKQ